jgi:hypothetical protein
LDYCKKELKQQETRQEKFYFDEYDPVALQKIIDTQYKVIDYMKNQGHKNLYQIAIIIDDFIDSRHFTFSPTSLLNTLFIRGRHMMISTIVTSQSYKAISSIVRRNITEISIFRLRNTSDLDAWIDELSAVYDKKTLLQMYRRCTDQPYGFLYINLMSKSKETMFYDSMVNVLTPEN